MGDALSLVTATLAMPVMKAKEDPPRMMAVQEHNGEDAPLGTLVPVHLGIW